MKTFGSWKDKGLKLYIPAIFRSWVSLENLDAAAQARSNFS
jgi:hypothetical protein